MLVIGRSNNWSAGVVPSNTDKVYILASPSVGNEQPVANENSTTIQQLAIEDLASVTLSGGTTTVTTQQQVMAKF